MDVIRVGSADSRRVLLITSACHGIEGHAGSAAQIAVLRDFRLLKRMEASGVALLLVHALNPYGFSYSRRSTAENVDLNRNVIDFNRPLPANEDYRQFHSLLVPETWPPFRENERALVAAIEQRGLRRFQAIVTRGQYEFPDGMFFGGLAPTWCHQTFRAVLREWAPAIGTAAWIDIHTGLGRCGIGERIFTGGGSAAAESLARQWWGEITQTEDGTSASAELTGTLAGIVRGELGGRLATSITLEIGTTDPMQVMDALRADAWAHRTGSTSGPWRQLAAKAMREAFFIDTCAWKEAVLEQAMSAIGAAAQGIARCADQ